MRPSSWRSRMPTFISAVTSPWTALTSRPTRRAASRIDTGPAPQRTLSSAHRLGVKTRQSNSGVAKLMRADLWGLPVFQTRAKSAMESAGVRTSRITVFMVPPRNIILEVSYQPIRCRENIGTFLPSIMSVIAFPRLVVVTQDACSSHNVSQPIFVRVRRTFLRLWQTPQDQLSK